MAKKRGKRYQTQWAGQYGVAHELTLRGYLVALTVGNAPITDLLCQSPEGTLFSIEVKSLSSKTYFLFQDSLLERKPDRYVVFVLLPRSPSERPEYYVLSNEQFLKVAEEQKRRDREAEKRRGKPYAAFSRGINYSTLSDSDCRDAWHVLPN
ncbi:MAG: hypothetical protein U9R68_04545 [Planctomycetota bacterium]|nr:hypothetical protein [Planctomycetota bacterium]